MGIFDKVSSSVKSGFGVNTKTPKEMVDVYIEQMDSELNRLYNEFCYIANSKGNWNRRVRFDEEKISENYNAMEEALAKGDEEAAQNYKEYYEKYKADLEKDKENLSEIEVKYKRVSSIYNDFYSIVESIKTRRFDIRVEAVIKNTQSAIIAADEQMGKLDGRRVEVPDFSSIDSVDEAFSKLQSDIESLLKKN